MKQEGVKRYPSDAHPGISCSNEEKKSKHPKQDKGVGGEQLDLGELADIRLSSAWKSLSDEALSSPQLQVSLSVDS